MRSRSRSFTYKESVEKAIKSLDQQSNKSNLSAKIPSVKSKDNVPSPTEKGTDGPSRSSLTRNKVASIRSRGNGARKMKVSKDVHALLDTSPYAFFNEMLN